MCIRDSPSTSNDTPIIPNDGNRPHFTTFLAQHNIVDTLLVHQDETSSTALPMTHKAPSHKLFSRLDRFYHDSDLEALLIQDRYIDVCMKYKDLNLPISDHSPISMIVSTKTKLDTKIHKKIWRLNTHLLKSNDEFRDLLWLSLIHI